MNTKKALDLGALERLQELGGVDFVCSMIELFFKTTDERLIQAVSAMKAGDLDGVEMATHGLVASAGFIGARQLEALAEQVTDAADRKDVEETRSLLSQIQEDYAKIRPSLEEAKQARLAVASRGA